MWKHKNYTFDITRKRDKMLSKEINQRRKSKHDSVN